MRWISILNFICCRMGTFVSVWNLLWITIWKWAQFPVLRRIILLKNFSKFINKWCAKYVALPASHFCKSGAADVCLPILKQQQFYELSCCYANNLDSSCLAPESRFCFTIRLQVTFSQQQQQWFQSSSTGSIRMTQGHLPPKKPYFWYLI